MFCALAPSPLCHICTHRLWRLSYNNRAYSTHTLTRSSVHFYSFATFAFVWLGSLITRLDTWDLRVDLVHRTWDNDIYTDATGMQFQGRLGRVGKLLVCYVRHGHAAFFFCQFIVWVSPIQDLFLAFLTWNFSNGNSFRAICHGMGVWSRLGSERRSGRHNRRQSVKVT